MPSNFERRPHREHMQTDTPTGTVSVEAFAFAHAGTQRPVLVEALTALGRDEKSLKSRSRMREYLRGTEQVERDF
jgi:hypothetical protein